MLKNNITEIQSRFSNLQNKNTGVLPVCVVNNVSSEQVVVPSAKPDNIYLIVAKRSDPLVNPNEFVAFSGGLTLNPNILIDKVYPMYAFATPKGDALFPWYNLSLLSVNGYDISEIKIQAPKALFQVSALDILQGGNNARVRKIFFSQFMNEKNYKDNILTMPVLIKTNEISGIGVDISNLLLDETVSVTVKIQNCNPYS